MGHRIVKRVPLDFDAPMETWAGYLVPETLRPTACPVCGPASRGSFGGFGDGLTPEARAIADTFYSTMIAASWDESELKRARVLAWSDKLGQAEVDNLIAHGRLRVWRDGKWVTEPWTAAEVNELNRRPNLDSHDAINRSILVEFRCERLGIEMTCKRCDGEGSVFPSDEARDAYEAWEPTEPPVGPGWQLWQTTTEGGPTSPVFATDVELADWCATGATAFASVRWTAGEWLASFRSETTDVDTLLVVRRDGERVSP